MRASTSTRRRSTPFVGSAFCTCLAAVASLLQFGGCPQSPEVRAPTAAEQTDVASHVAALLNGSGGRERDSEQLAVSLTSEYETSSDIGATWRELNAVIEAIVLSDPQAAAQSNRRMAGSILELSAGGPKLAMQTQPSDTAILFVNGIWVSYAHYVNDLTAFDTFSPAQDS